MTEAKIARFQKAGRGVGTGVAYTPWLTVHDLSSSGRVARMLGRCNKRIHHFFSDIERGAFLEADWRDDVVDIREQFPLDRGTTRLIAAEMGIAHPRDPHSRVDVVMTSDLVVTYSDGRVRPIACKAVSDLGKSRVAEKLEIERRYWRLLGRAWTLWTERSTTPTRTENLAYLHEYIDADDLHWVTPGYWQSRSRAFHEMLGRTDPATPFDRFAAAFDHRPGFHPGDAVATMRYLGCRKLIRFNLDLKFNHTAPIVRSLGPAPVVRLAEAA